VRKKIAPAAAIHRALASFVVPTAVRRPLTRWCRVTETRPAIVQRR
jgi:hypothetical protein